jgi:hypothetical protein
MTRFFTARFWRSLAALVLAIIIVGGIVSWVL